MAFRFNYEISVLLRKASVILLALFWTVGIALGIWSAYTCGSNHIFLMRSVPFGTVSIVSLMCVSVFPFLLSAFTVFLSHSKALLAIALVKGFFFSYISACLLFGFGSGDWLMRLLLMFSNICCLPILFWYWMRHISGDVSFSPWLTLFVASMLFLIGSIDFCCVSPFLAMLINS